MGLSSGVRSIRVWRTNALVTASTNEAFTVATLLPGTAAAQMRKCPTRPCIRPRSCCTPQPGQTPKTSPDGSPLEDAVNVTRGPKLAKSPSATSARARLTILIAASLLSPHVPALYDRLQSGNARGDTHPSPGQSQPARCDGVTRPSGLPPVSIADHSVPLSAVVPWPRPCRIRMSASKHRHVNKPTVAARPVAKLTRALGNPGPVGVA